LRPESGKRYLTNGKKQFTPVSRLAALGYASAADNRKFRMTCNATLALSDCAACHKEAQPGQTKD